MDLADSTRRQSSWRLNASLLTDPATLPAVWEPGEREREREAAIQKLVSQIATLKALHKQSLSTTSAGLLLEARRELQQMLDSTARCMLFFKKRLYYESGNKAGAPGMLLCE